jgi:hypothetical protein
MAADPANGTVVLFGGPEEGNCDVSTCSDQTWTWDGTRWTQQHPKLSPSARGGAALAYDPATRSVVLYGGWIPDLTANPPNVVYLGDTWSWNGKDWTKQCDPCPPGERLTSLVTDPATRSVLLEGGQHADPSSCTPPDIGCFFEPVLPTDTWTWNGRNWIKRHPHTQPTLGSGSAFASDPATRTVVLFGGGSPFAGPQSDQTWTWNGRDWTRQFPLIHPTARTGNGLAYDPATRRVVLFGGQQALPPPSPFPAHSDETWTWDGTDWTQQQPLQSPSPREYPGMATDPATCSVVLFGGETLNPDFSATALGDTWVYTSSRGAPDQFDQHAATQHENEGAPNCSPRED